MKAQPVSHSLNRSQGDFVLLCVAKAEFMLRDADDFATRGVLPERITAFIAQTQVVAKLPSDKQLDYPKQVLTEAAQKQRLLVESGMATVMSKVSILHKDTSAAYKAFGSGGLYNDSEGDFYLGINHLVDHAQLHLDEYVKQGLTADELTVLNGENEKYLLAVKAQRRGISARTLAAQARQGALATHDEELNALCGVGQGLYKQTSNSKYADYVVNPAEHPSTPAVA
jgi:hypothetical protein